MTMLLSPFVTTHSRAFNAIIPFGLYRRSDDIDMACNLHLWIAHTDGQCRAWHMLIAIVLYIQSNKVKRGIPLWRFKNSHDHTT